MKSIQTYLKGSFIAALLLMMASCGGSDGTTGFCAFTTLDPVTLDLNGTWQITETTSSSNPDCDGEVRVYNIEVTVSGNSISVFSPDLGTTFTGEISGNEIKWSGSFPDDGGTTTVLCAEITATSSDSITGSSTFEFEDGDIECSGTTSITGFKL